LFAQSNDVKNKRLDVSNNSRSSRSRPRRTFQPSKSQRLNTVRQMLQKKREDASKSTEKTNAAIGKNPQKTLKLTSAELLSDDLAQLIDEVIAAADVCSVNSFDFEPWILHDDLLPNLELQ
jgi:hypothetical protein